MSVSGGLIAPSPRTHPRSSARLFSTRLIVGILIIFVGAILLADNLGWFEARYILRSLWPLALVAVGVGDGAQSASPAQPRLGLGADHGRLLDFLDRIGWIHVSLGQLLLPGILLFVGGVLVFRALNGPPKPRGQLSGAERSRRVRALVRDAVGPRVAAGIAAVSRRRPQRHHGRHQTGPDRRAHGRRHRRSSKCSPSGAASKSTCRRTGPSPAKSRPCSPASSTSGVPPASCRPRHWSCKGMVVMSGIEIKN